MSQLCEHSLHRFLFLVGTPTLRSQIWSHPNLRQKKDIKAPKQLWKNLPIIIIELLFGTKLVGLFEGFGINRPKTKLFGANLRKFGETIVRVYQGFLRGNFQLLLLRDPQA